MIPDGPGFLGAEARADPRYPRYRALTGPDEDAFCHRVSEALALGYELYGAPAATYDGQRVILCQALIWPFDGAPPER